MRVIITVALVVYGWMTLGAASVQAQCDTSYPSGYCSGPFSEDDDLVCEDTGPGDGSYECFTDDEFCYCRDVEPPPPPEPKLALPEVSFDREPVRDLSLRCRQRGGFDARFVVQSTGTQVELVHNVDRWGESILLFENNRLGYSWARGPNGRFFGGTASRQFADKLRRGETQSLIALGGVIVDNRLAILDCGAPGPVSAPESCNTARRVGVAACEGLAAVGGIIAGASGIGLFAAAVVGIVCLDSIEQEHNRCEQTCQCRCVCSRCEAFQGALLEQCRNAAQ